MNFNNVIPGCVDQLIDQYNILQNNYIENVGLEIQIQRAKVVYDRLIMSVKIDRNFEKELFQVGFDKDISKRIIIESPNPTKSRCCVRFKIKNCGIDEFDAFVKSLLDRGIRTLIFGKKLNSAYDGPEPRSFVAQSDGETDLRVDDRYVHVVFKKGDVLIRSIKKLSINNVVSSTSSIVRGVWKHYSVVRVVNANYWEDPQYSPLAAMYPKYIQ